jgi:hypothetical protein
VGPIGLCAERIRHDDTQLYGISVRGDGHADMSTAPSDIARPQTFRRALTPFRVRIRSAGIELLEVDRDMPAAFTPAQRLCGAEQKAQLPVVVAVYNVPDSQAVFLRLRLGKPVWSQPEASMSYVEAAYHEAYPRFRMYSSLIPLQRRG